MGAIVQQRGMKMSDLQKVGGLAALYMAAAYALGIVLFLVVLDYPNITDAAQKIALVVDKQLILHATNLILYVVFGVALIVLVVALYERMKGGTPALTRVASAIGLIWAGSLIASGMVANAGISPAVALHAKDPALAAMAWAQIEAVANGLGNANGEILGGLLTLLTSWAGLRAGSLPRVLNYLGVVVGLIGIASTVPGLNDLAGIFGIGQILWFVGLALVMLRGTARGAS
jgi:Domain of unknown function (DUF4386)